MPNPQASSKKKYPQKFSGEQAKDESLGPFGPEDPKKSPRESPVSFGPRGRKVSEAL